MVEQLDHLINTPSARDRLRRNGRVLTLNSAIQVIGDNGLRTVIARAVIHPMFTAHGDGLAMRSAQLRKIGIYSGQFRSH